MQVNSHTIIALSFLFSDIAIAQENRNGIYLTPEDFSNRNLKHCSANTRFKLHDFLEKDIVDVKCNDSIYSYTKSDIFGYSDNEGNAYRFFNRKTYLIINPTEKILIYKKYQGPVQKGQKPSYSYYFSKDATGKLIPLSLDNLLIVFSDNKPFQNIIEIHFNNQSDLLEYDNLHKQYKLNRLLEISKNEKL